MGDVTDYQHAQDLFFAELADARSQLLLPVAADLIVAAHADADRAAEQRAAITAKAAEAVAAGVKHSLIVESFTTADSKYAASKRAAPRSLIDGGIFGVEDMVRWLLQCDIDQKKEKGAV